MTDYTKMSVDELLEAEGRAYIAGDECVQDDAVVELARRARVNEADTKARVDAENLAAELRGKLTESDWRLRLIAQRIIAAIGAVGPEDAEHAVGRMIDKLAAADPKKGVQKEAAETWLRATYEARTALEAAVKERDELRAKLASTVEAGVKHRHGMWHKWRDAFAMPDEPDADAIKRVRDLLDAAKPAPKPPADEPALVALRVKPNPGPLDLAILELDRRTR